MENDKDALDHLAQVAEKTRKEIYTSWDYSWRRYGKLTDTARRKIDILKKKLSIVNDLADDQLQRVKNKWVS